MPTKRNVFISYAWADRDLVANLVRELEKRQLKVWFDGHSISAGEDLDRVTKEAISDAWACIIVLSSASDAARAFTSKEWSAIQEASWQRDDLKLCPVRIGDVELPPFLRRWQSIDLPKASADLGRAAEQIAVLIDGADTRPPAGIVEQERSRAAARIADLQRTLFELRKEDGPAPHHEQGG